MSATYKLDQWAVVYRRGCPFSPPELSVLVLSGTCKGHPDFIEDHYVVTSRLVGRTDKGLVVTQSGSQIELLEVSPEYAAEYFNPRERLLNSLSVVA
jgi:hypothetical protein